MSSFDLFLVGDESPELGDTLQETLARLPHLIPSPGDPTRFAYRNPDTTVHFNILLSPHILESARHSTNVLPDASEMDASGIEDEDDEEEEDLEADGGDDENYHDDEDTDGGETDDDEPLADFPPVGISVPLFRPSFFVGEALDVIEPLREASGLPLHDAQEDETESDGGSREAILESWRRWNLQQVERLRDPDQLCHWNAERCHRFYSYASRRAELEEILGNNEALAPQLHPARHEGEIKSLAIWRCDQPVILPRCDLILLERPREKRGLFGARRVIDEILVPADEVWTLLAPFAEIREEPAPVLIYRQAADHPAQVQRALDGMEGGAVDAARRCELAGVIDFELPA